jgi:hypothetical protein
VFRDYDLKLAYLLGIGIQRCQLSSMVLDFIIIYAISMYILIFRNPVIMKRMQKVFWQFPTLDDVDEWARLDELTRKQVLWLYDPLPYDRFQ